MSCIYTTLETLSGHIRVDKVFLLEGSFGVELVETIILLTSVLEDPELNKTSRIIVLFVLPIESTIVILVEVHCFILGVGMIECGLVYTSCAYVVTRITTTYTLLFHSA